MVKTNKLVALLAAFSASLAALLLVQTGQAFAATKTWSGTDCPATDCNWSNANNWVGGVIPANGDDIVIDASAANPDRAEISDIDIVGLSIASLTTSGYTNSGVAPYSMIITASQAFTLTGNVTHNIAATAAPSGWEKATYLVLGTSNKAITLGGDVSTQNVELTGSTLTLGGYTLTYGLNSSYGVSASTFRLSAQVTGSGTLTINIDPQYALFMDATNNYSGTTNVDSVDYMSSLGSSTGIFGTSTINLSAQARILFENYSDGNVTINNTINITPPATTGTFLSNQLEFWSHAAAVNFSVPHIVLNGNARFGTNKLAGAVVVDLTGITANNHCIQYGDNNSDVADFTNGPAACVVAVASDAKTPDTGFVLIKSNPLAMLLITSMIAGAIFIIAHRSGKFAAKKIK